MENQFLPIGTVVRLKESTADVMIAGYLPINPSQPNYVWDYSGFKYPIGYVDNNEVYCFDGEQIEEIHAIGYQDKEQLAFAAELEEMAEEVRIEAQMYDVEYPDETEEEEK